MAKTWFARSFAIAGTVMAGLALVFSLLVLDEEPWFGIGTSITWMVLNFPGQVVSMIISGDIHHTTGAGFYLGTAVQWFLIGYFAMRWFHHRGADRAPRPSSGTGAGSSGTAGSSGPAGSSGTGGRAGGGTGPGGAA